MSKSLHQQFINPPEEFSPIPFWFWNDSLTKEEIHRQIYDFYKKGVTGFVLHPRIGIPKEIEYLSREFMALVKTAVQKADELGMSVILYDEAMYPSGAAKGMVVKNNPEYASRGLKMEEHSVNSHKEVEIELEEGEQLISVQAVKKLSDHSIAVDETKILEIQDNKVSFKPPTQENWSILLFIETFTEGHIRGIHFGEDDGEENAPRSADLLNPNAVRKFITITHDTYYNTLKQYFGNTVMAMFTDEPDILGRGSIPDLKPWTNDFLAYYKQYENLETHLPVLWFEAGENTASIRKAYRKTVNNKLIDSYYKQISEWCEQHQIALTGHPAASDDIGLLENFQIPGQDVVWRWVAPEDGKALEGEHSTAGKCSADAARHRGRRRNLNEFLGVCGKESDWALSAGDMKWYMDWLLVRGVNLLSPHAFYYSIDGKRRSHERPPDVGPNNVWWPYYKHFAQYMKRVSWLMTDSINDTKIAVLCEEDHLPWKIAKPLYQNQIEFNYLEETLLKDKCKIENGKITIQHQSYQVVLIESSVSLDKEVVEKLKQFTQQGGKIMMVGKEDQKIGLTIPKVEEVVTAIPASYRSHVKLTPSHQDIRVSKVKKDGHFFYLLVNEGEEHYQGTFLFNEKGKVEKWDAWEGTVEEQLLEDEQQVPIDLPRRSSIIYCINPNEEPNMFMNNKSITSGQQITAVEGEWQITNAPIAIQKASLGSWTKWKGMETFSGTITYENTFDWKDLSLDNDIYLELGEVHQLANVFINDKELGVKMWAPYSWEVNPTLLTEGRNTIRIEVTNSMANQMDNAELPSGLMGPVSFITVS